MKRTPLKLLRPSHPSDAPSKHGLIESVRKAVERARRLQVAYSDDDWSPLSDITLALLLDRAGIRWKYVPLRGLVEIIWPPLCGIHVILGHEYLAPGERRFAVRHGLAHVLVGDSHERMYARSEREWDTESEGIADLFAIADLVPDRVIREVLAAGLNPVEVERWIQGEIWRYVPNWPEARINDRAARRWDLFQEPQ